MEREEELPGRDQAERPAKGDGARAVMAEWLSLTARLLDGLGLTVAELQELVAMQGKVNELVERSAAAGEADEAAADRPSFRRVL